MLTPLIVGFGHAGRDLHLPCLRKVAEDRGGALQINPLHVIDPRLTDRSSLLPAGVVAHDDLESAMRVLGPDTVVHVTTPPNCHASTLGEAISVGFNRIIIEKPLAENLAEARRMAESACQPGIDVLVVANWLSSSLTQYIIDRIDIDPRFTPIGTISLRQTKSRLTRTRTDQSHKTAFDIEMPHMVALALLLAGEEAHLVTASSTDMAIGDNIHQNLGTAYMETQHIKGIRCQIYTDLSSPIRERVIEYRTITGSVKAYFPPDGSDSFSYLFLLDKNGMVCDRIIIHDDPLTNFIEYSYRYFIHGVDRPASDVKLNIKIVSLLEQAKLHCDCVGLVEVG